MVMVTVAPLLVVEVVDVAVVVEVLDVEPPEVREPVVPEDAVVCEVEPVVIVLEVVELDVPEAELSLTLCGGIGIDIVMLSLTLSSEYPKLLMAITSNVYLINTGNSAGILNRGGTTSHVVCPLLQPLKHLTL